MLKTVGFEVDSRPLLDCDLMVPEVSEYRPAGIYGDCWSLYNNFTGAICWLEGDMYTHDHS